MYEIKIYLHREHTFINIVKVKNCGAFTVLDYASRYKYMFL